jgi:hypothetical protein
MAEAVRSMQAVEIGSTACAVILFAALRAAAH